MRTPAARRRLAGPRPPRPPPFQTGSGSADAADLVRRRTGPGGEHLPARRRDPGGSGTGRASAAMASAAVEAFVTKQLDLLELERDAEVEERRYGRRPSSRGGSGSSPALICSDPGDPPGSGLPQKWKPRPLSLGSSFWFWRLSFFGPKPPFPNFHSEILPLPSWTPSACSALFLIRPRCGC